MKEAHAYTPPGFPLPNVAPEGYLIGPRPTWLRGRSLAALRCELSKRAGNPARATETSYSFRWNLPAFSSSLKNGEGPGVRLRKGKSLDQHIEHLEGKVAGLKPAATGKPSPATGMAMLRRGRAKRDLAKAKNKRAKVPK